MLVQVSCFSHLVPELYAIGHRHFTDKYRVTRKGPQMSNYKSHNNFLMMMKLCNSVHFKPLTRCLPGSCQFLQCVSPSFVRLNDVYVWVPCIFCTCAWTGLRDRSNNATRLSETVSVLQYHQRALFRRWSETKGTRRLSVEFGLQWTVTRRGTCESGSWFHLQSRYVICCRRLYLRRGTGENPEQSNNYNRLPAQNEKRSLPYVPHSVLVS
jgi:hypothetical protein